MRGLCFSSSLPHSNQTGQCEQNPNSGMQGATDVERRNEKAKMGVCHYTNLSLQNDEIQKGKYDRVLQDVKQTDVEFGISQLE